MESKETHRLRQRIHDCRGEGKLRDFGKVMHTRLYLKWIINKDLLYSTWTLLNVTWQPGWEGSLVENRHTRMYDWVPLLFIWNYHSVVNRLNSNTEKKSLKFGEKNRKMILHKCWVSSGIRLPGFDSWLYLPAMWPQLIQLPLGLTYPSVQWG